MRKITAIILIMAFILSLIPINSYAIESEQEFFNYLDSIGVRRTNKGNKVANYLTYKEYGLIVYGSPWGDRKPTGINGKTGPQYRYLGYTLEDDPYTNPYFPPDASSGNKPENFNYIKPSGAEKSWESLTDKAQKEHMLYSTLSGNGATSPSFTLASIGGYAYGKLLSPSTWKSQGSIYLQHKTSSGKIWYITQTTPPMVGDTIVTGEISTPSDTYYIRKDETQVKIPVTVTARAVKSGRAEDKHIREIKATSLGQSQTASGIPTVSKTSDFVATRANYKPGTHTITLNGSVSLISIFNDSGSLNLSKTITLIVEAEGEEPYVTTTVTPEPSQVKFEEEDIEVILTVNGELHNYTKTSNIKEWVFYAREKESSKALEKKVYKKSLTASTDFKFTIPASKVTEDNFKQYYVVRARVYFNQKVNGKDYYDAPAETVVVVYKDKPPIEPPEPIPEPPGSGNIPPVTQIDGPTVIRAGLTGTYRAKSSDEDGYIEFAEFRSSTWPYTESKQETREKIRYSFSKVFTLDDVGDMMIEHIVTDNEGAKGSDFLYVEVQLPRPDAELKFSGKLKENRQVIITNTSTSYGSPMNDSKTRITVKPYGDGATKNITYLGASPDNLERYYIFKDRGIYEVEIYVENMLGISDSRKYYINIHPDIPPVADFSFDSKVYRDKNNNNFATMEITDLSYSPDGDKITEKIWTITYNSNNNKDSDGFPNYSDDISFTVKDSELELFKEKTLVKNGFTYRITKIADDKITIQANQVGHYLIELEVMEDYGLEGNTDYKHKMEKTITIYNREPFADFEP